MNISRATILGTLLINILLNPESIFGNSLNKITPRIKLSTEKNDRDKPEYPLPRPTSLSAVLLAACYGNFYDDCSQIEDYKPRQNVTDEQFLKISSECNFYAVEDWDSSGPILSDSCFNTIKNILPLDDTLKNPPDSKSNNALKALVYGFHFLIFYPIADTGDLMGDHEFYCSDIYQGYFGAQQQSDSFQKQTLAESSYNDLSQMNVHLARFIIERVKQFKYYANTPDLLIAGEDNNSIYLSPKFGDSDRSPIDTASTLIHESRHIGDGFSDEANHVACEYEEFGNNCDDLPYGAYGAELAYLDALAKGSGQTSLDDGFKILSDDDLFSSLQKACFWIHYTINDPGSSLEQIFPDALDCDDLNNEIGDELFRNIYGFAISER